MPNTNTYDLQFSPVNNGTVVAGTFGRGAWEVSNANATLFSAATLLVCGDQDTTNENDTFRLVRNAANPSLLDVFVNNTTAVPNQEIPIALIGKIAIYGGGGNNTLIVDSSNGLIANGSNGLSIDWNAADPCPTSFSDGEVLDAVFRVRTASIKPFCSRPPAPTRPR